MTLVWFNPALFSLSMTDGLDVALSCLWVMQSRKETSRVQTHLCTLKSGRGGLVQLHVPWGWRVAGSGQLSGKAISQVSEQTSVRAGEEGTLGGRGQPRQGP